MIRVGCKALRHGKLVKVIAELEDGTFVCRYMEDINGKHATRCYISTRSELVEQRELLKSVTVYVVDECSVVIGKLDYEQAPSDADIKEILCNTRGAARVIVENNYVFE